MKNLYLFVSAFSLLAAGSAYAALDCAALPSHLPVPLVCTHPMPGRNLSTSNTLDLGT